MTDFHGVKPLWFISVIVLALSATVTAAADFTPSNPPEMKPIRSHSTAAYRAAKLFLHGVNLGNYLEAPPGKDWGITYDASEFAQIRHEGFDHVRVPIGWQHYAGPAPDFMLSPEIFSRVDFVVTNALAAHLAVLINIHHFDEFDHDPTNATPEFLTIWKQVAAHYKKFPTTLAFELDNEPHLNATTKAVNPIYALAIAEIRKTNPKRTLFVEPGNWGGLDQITNLVLPPDKNIIVSAHCYDPFYFTHQGATWTGQDTSTTNIIFPGPPATPLTPATNATRWVAGWIKNYNTLPTDKNPSSPIAFTEKLKFVRAWSDYYGRPVHIGEFGCYTKADPASRANFYAAFRRAAEDQKLGWAIWDWSAGFRYWDKQNNRPMPGMHEALFEN